MSASSDNHLPSPPDHDRDEVINASWDELATLVRDADPSEFVQWLDDELNQMEEDLQEFVSENSRYSGRR